jgi:thiol:disulfide interchange protein
MNYFKIFLTFSFILNLNLYSQPKERQVKWMGEPQSRSIISGEQFAATILVKINPGWHLYSTSTPPEGAQPTKFEIKGDKYFKLKSKVEQLKPIVKYEEVFGANTEYYTDNTKFYLTILSDKNTPAGKYNINVSVTYMMCNDKFCLPPLTDEIKIPIEVLPSGKNIEKNEVVKNDNSKIQESTDTSKKSELLTSTYQKNDDNKKENKITQNVPSIIPMSATDEVEKAKSEGLLSYIGFAMTMGALALLTPCVFPMIPITVSFFTKRDQKSRKQGIRDAFLYSFGIIFTFVVLGFLLAFILGASGINQFAANPWINLVIASIFIIFALNLFGSFEIALPSSILTKLNNASTGKSGTISILLMGLTFSLTSFTCTVPFIGTIMVAAAKGDWLWPIIGMLAYSTVFSLPFFLLALFPMFLKSMPKSGGWLNSVKVVMGFLEIAAAMKFMSNADLVWRCGILTYDFFLSGWIAIAILIVIYLLGKIQLPHDTPVEKIGVLRLIFAMLFLSIGFYLFTGLLGHKLGELDAFLPPREYPGSASIIGIVSHGGANEAKELYWYSNYEKAQEEAKKESKNLFLDFTGYTCTNCRWMESNVFTNPVIKDLLSKYILVRLYTDGQGDEYSKNRKMQEERFGTIALPFYVILNREDKLVSSFPGLSRDLNEFKVFLENGLR